MSSAAKQSSTLAAPSAGALLVTSQDVINEDVLSLLEHDHDLSVAVVTCVDDARFLDDVAAIQPAVILLNEARPVHLPDILSLIGQSPALARVRIITYGLGGTSVEVYDHRRVTIVEREDFLELLHT